MAGEMMRDILGLQKRVERLEVRESSIYVPLTAPLTSTSFDGDAFSTTAKTLIDLSVAFGVPAGVKAIDCNVIISDSGSAAQTDIWFILSPTNTNYSGRSTYCGGLANSARTCNSVIVPCDANGDVYYQCKASGAGTMTVYIQIYGYWY